MLAKTAGTTPSKLRLQTPEDEAAIETLMAATFGDARHQRSVWNLRLGAPVANLCFVQSYEDKIIGSLRYWPIMVGGMRGLLLGPLAVSPEFKGRGFGKELVSHSLDQAKHAGYPFVLVSGEPDYYPQFGFEKASTSSFLWPGFIEAERLQIKWLKPEAKANAPGIKAILPYSS